METGRKNRDAVMSRGAGGARRGLFVGQGLGFGVPLGFLALAGAGTETGL